jgi:hypothetical protein
MEWSLGWSTNGTGDGIASGYTQAKFTEMLEAWFHHDDTEDGIFPAMGSALAVSASGGTASPVTIQAGAAQVKGFFYRNDAAGTKNIPTPAGNTRIDQIVLRADWGSQTVRFERVAGAEGGGTPALTQTDNTTWEIPLATTSTTTGGVVTVADVRNYIQPELYKRQGGAAGEWDTAGTTNYTPAATRMQAGVRAVTIADGTDSVQSTVTYPVAFSAGAVVQITMGVNDATAFDLFQVLNSNTTGFDIKITRAGTSGTDNYDVHWLAIGPK